MSGGRFGPIGCVLHILGGCPLLAIWSHGLLKVLS